MEGAGMGLQLQSTLLHTPYRLKKKKKGQDRWYAMPGVTKLVGVRAGTIQSLEINTEN